MSSSCKTIVEIPIGLEVHEWKVKDGSSVRKDEVVAVAKEKGANISLAAAGNSNNNNNNKASSSSHRRPSRKKKKQFKLSDIVKSKESNNNTINNNNKEKEKQPTTKENDQKPPAASVKTASVISSSSSSSSSENNNTNGNNTSISKPKEGNKNGTLVTTSTKNNILKQIKAPSNGIIRIQPIPNEDDSTTTSSETTVKETTTKSTRIIAIIEPCSHPAVIENLCAVCGESISPQQSNDNNNNNNNNTNNNTQQPAMARLTVSGGITMTITKQEAQEISEHNTKRLWKQKKLSLVLDLDHTLVHATADARAANALSRAPTKRTDVRSLLLPGPPNNNQKDNMLRHKVKLRPHIKQFLDNPNYEISVYTAGTRSYAEQITMILSRYMVGANLDHEQIITLRERFEQAERQFKQSQQDTAVHEEKEQENGKEKKDSVAETKEETKQDSASPDQNMQESNESMDITTTTTTTTTSDSKKRPREESSRSNPAPKKVRFGTPPPGAKTDAITEEQVNQYREEFEAAKKQENEALQLRQRIFGSRIVSRTDVGDLGKDVKSLKRVFPCGGTMAVVVDDREDVWANAGETAKKNEPPQNLLLVQPYHWKPFLGCADVNNAAGQDLTKSTTKEKKEGMTDAELIAEINKPETDKQLLWTRNILDRLHQRYFAQESKHIKTVPEILKQMRREVLRGCCMVLSGLVPLNKPSEYSGPLLRYVDWMGGRRLDSVNRSTTHVVAARDGTNKTKEGRRIPGCKIVKASWLMECYWSMERRHEANYLMGAQPRQVLVNAASSSRLNGAASGQRLNNHITGTDDDDDDDDDFEDELFANMGDT